MPGGRIKNTIDSNPYRRFVEPQPGQVECEVCDRVMPVADWQAHSRGRKHKAAQAERDAASKPSDFHDSANEQDIVQMAPASGAWGDDATVVDDGWTSAPTLSSNPSRGGARFNTNNSSSDGCRKCGQSGHWARECPNKTGGSDNTCRKCGEEGHFARDCTSSVNRGFSGACYNCGQEGHSSRDCTEPRKAGGGGGGFSGACYNCGVEGHSAKNCPDAPKGGGGGRGLRTCYNCNQTGHISRDCPGEGGASYGENTNPNAGGLDDGFAQDKTVTGSAGGNWDSTATTIASKTQDEDDAW